MSKFQDLTPEQSSRLETYLLASTKYREGEIEACKSLGKERDDNGKLKFPNMAANAVWWEETHQIIQGIINPDASK